MLALLLLFVAGDILSLQDLTVGEAGLRADKFLAGAGRSIRFQSRHGQRTGHAGRRHRLLWPRRFWPAASAGCFWPCAWFLGAAQQVSVTQMATGLYTHPLFVTLLAGPLLGERIGVWRLGALALGAVGCGLAQPDRMPSRSTSWCRCLPVSCSATFWWWALPPWKAHWRSPALSIWCSSSPELRRAGDGASSRRPGCARSCPSFSGWPELTAVLVAILAGLAVLNLFGNLFLSRAYQTADSSLLAPLDFSYLLRRPVGRLLFESWPTPLAILGMSMIAAAGMITAFASSVVSAISPQVKNPLTGPPQFSTSSAFWPSGRNWARA